MPQDLRSTIEPYREPMIALAGSLVRMATENPPGAHYSACADLLAEHLRTLGFPVVARDQDCVLAFTAAQGRTLYFHGHYDVVPAQAPAQFTPELRGANLFGRGSSDMKSGLAAMIYAAHVVRGLGRPLNGRIGLVFVPDEETAGPRGSRHLESRGLLGVDAIGMLTPEPTGGVVWNTNRGAITLRVVVKGKTAHVGRQFEGRNAFEDMVTVVQSLQQLKREVEQRATAGAIAPERARHSILLLGGRVEGGANFNAVPESCSFTVDRRINPEEDFATEQQRLLAILQQARDSGIELRVEILQEGHSGGTAIDGPLAKALAHNIGQITGEAARFEMCPGLLETRFYAAKGIPAFAYGPGLLTVSHGPDEFVPVERMVRCAEIYAQTALDLLAE